MWSSIRAGVHSIVNGDRHVEVFDLSSGKVHFRGRGTSGRAQVPSAF